MFIINIYIKREIMKSSPSFIRYEQKQKKSKLLLVILMMTNMNDFGMDRIYMGSYIIGFIKFALLLIGLILLVSNLMELVKFKNYPSSIKSIFGLTSTLDQVKLNIDIALYMIATSFIINIIDTFLLLSNIYNEKTHGIFNHNIRWIDDKDAKSAKQLIPVALLSKIAGYYFMYQKFIYEYSLLLKIYKLV